MRRGRIVEPSKKLEFGDVIPGGNRRRAAEGDKTYTKAVKVPEGARTDKSSRIVYDADGNRIGRRVAASRPMYVPDKKNAGSLSRQGAENINRSRGRTRAELDAGAPSNRDAGRQQPSTPSPAPRRPRPAPAPAPRRPEAAPERVASRSAKALSQPTGGSRSLKVAKPEPKPAAASAPASSGNKKVDKIKARAEKRVGKIQDRRARSSKRAAVKEARAAGRAMVKEAKGKAKYGKIKMKPGGLKQPSEDQKGLKKLPTAVRNKMGYAKKGKMIDRRAGGYGKKKK